MGVGILDLRPGCLHDSGWGALGAVQRSFGMTPLGRAASVTILPVPLAILTSVAFRHMI